MGNAAPRRRERGWEMSIRLIRSGALVAMLGLTLAGCGRYSISNIRALKAFGDANKLYQKAQYADAATRYQDVIVLDPQPPIKGFAYFFLGNSYDNMYKPSKKGDPNNDANLPKAVENYKLAIQNLQGSENREPEMRKLAYEYLIAAFGTDKLNDLSQAEPVAQQLIALEPNEPGNYEALGLLYEQAKRMDDAERNFKKAVEVKPNDGQTYVTLAGFYNRQTGQFPKTIEALEGRARVEPNNPEAWHTMAAYYADEVLRDTKLTPATTKDYIEKGLAADDKALAVNPEYAEAMIYKGILLRAKVAKVVKDPAQQKALTDEADKLKEKAIEIQKKQNAAGGAKKGGD
jgi:tetratricopeptide (TPR) repeat protein